MSLPKLSAATLKEIRSAKTRAECARAVGGNLKTGKRAPKPITLRLAPEKR